MGKLVVLGADGFIGRHLVASLTQSFKGDIIAFDRFSNYTTGGPHAFEKYSNVQIVTGNFFNRNELSDVLGADDTVFHLVSSTSPATSDSDPLIDVDTNIRGSIELFQLCVENKVKKVVFLSSGGTVYGDISSDSINELTLPAPRSPYGIGKLTIEHYLRYFKFTSGLDYIVYRVANPYGPGQNVVGKQGVIPIFMHKVLEKQPITIFGDGSMIRDYFSIHDLARMIVQSYAKTNRYNEYNLGSGQGITVNQLITAIESCAGYTVKRTHIDTPATYIHKSVLDITRFAEEFSLKPTISLEEGLKETWDYVKKVA